MEATMSQMPGLGPVDEGRVKKFHDDLMDPTELFSKFGDQDRRVREIDQRIRDAGLSLAEKVEVLRRLAPSAEDSRLRSGTDERKELRMERLLLSIDPQDLPACKFALEYDGNYKDLEEYLYHDIDRDPCRDRIVAHFRKTPGPCGVKVLTDVDDTMYPNFLDGRYPRPKAKKDKKPYPGVVDFYDALKEEPFLELPAIPVTTLSARPSPIGGTFEGLSLRNLRALTGQRLLPSGLSGDLGATTVGGVQDLLRPKLENDLEILSDDIPHDQADKIGQVKFEKFANFSRVYPEYRYVFVGDSGQADALTASLMLTDSKVEGCGRVVTTFIHDLGASPSPAFRALDPNLKITRTSPSGRGVIVFRNYIEAALVAHLHSATLQNLVTVEKLARVTQAALADFKTLTFEDAESKRKLSTAYRQDAEEAAALVAAAVPGQPSLAENVTAIRQILDAEL
jgi:hypothetical protein